MEIGIHCLTKGGKEMVLVKSRGETKAFELVFHWILHLGEHEVNT